MKLLLGLSVLGAIAFSAQDPAPRPNFSGVWIEDTRPTPPPDTVPYCPSQCTIKHSADQLVFEWTFKEFEKGKPFKKVIDLVKPEVTVSTPAGGGATTSQTTRTAWQAGTLVITREFGLPPKPPSLTLPLKLTMRDDKLVISGTDSIRGGGSAPFEVIYRKQTVELPATER